MAERSRRARPTIFICYRRKDTEDFAGRLKDRLEGHFGKRARIFFDHSEINYGDAFPQEIEEALKATRALVAVIGRQWADARDAKTGERRLENREDFVRREIAHALEAKVPVIPVLKDAEMPTEDVLPEDLKPLAHRHAQVFSAHRFERDAEDLIKALEKFVPPPPPPPGPDKFLEGLEEYGSQQPESPVQVPAGVRAAGAVIMFIFVIFMLFISPDCR